MADKLTATGGDGSINVAGNDIALTILEHESFQRSILYDLCVTINQSAIVLEEEDQYSTRLNSDWLEKLEYNNVSVYAEIFGEESYAYGQVEDVIREYPNSVEMVRKVRHIYLLVEKDRLRLDEDGDYVLERVFKELCQLVDESKRPLELQLPIEQKERYIKLIMFYVFTRCQLLKNVGA